MYKSSSYFLVAASMLLLTNYNIVYGQSIEMEPLTVYGVPGTTATSVKQSDGSSKFSILSSHAVWKTLSAGKALSIDLDYVKGSINCTGPSREEIGHVLEGLNIMKGKLEVAVIFPYESLSAKGNALAKRRLESIVMKLESRLGSKISILKGSSARAARHEYTSNRKTGFETLRFRFKLRPVDLGASS